MAQEITLRIEDDSEAVYLFDGIAIKWKYEAMIGEPPTPNPESKKEFITRIIGEMLKNVSVQGYQETNHDAVRATVDAIEILGL
jgi:hypothetical protein